MAFRLDESAYARRLLQHGSFVALALGGGHLAVDLGSHFVVARLVRWTNPDDLVNAFLAYNFFQLGIQPLFGALSDRLRRPRAVALFGVVLVAGSLWVIGPSVWLAIGLCGLGNTIFHIGAGTTSMRATPFLAAGPGLFIAPGAIGVAFARTWGKVPTFPLWPIVCFLGLAALIAVLAPVRRAAPEPTEQPQKRSLPGWLLAATLSLLLVAVAIRAFVGLRVSASFSGHVGWLLPLAAATFAGKALGGIVADRLGWRLISTAALFASAALFILAGDRLPLAVLGILLFQVITGVTLSALWCLMPRWPGLAFGLNCTALFVGSVPVVGRWGLPSSLPADAALTVVAAVAVWGVLTLMLRQEVKLGGTGSAP